MLESTQFEQYAGRYQCFAENSWGTAISRKVDVQIATQASTLKRDDAVLNVRVGTSVNKPCRNLYAISDEMDITLKFSRSPVNQSERITLSPNGNVVFSNVLLSDHELMVYCMITFRYTRSSVQGTHYSLNVSENLPGEMVPIAPSIVYPRENQEVIAMKGEDLTLSCIATGDPTPKVCWHNGSDRCEPTYLNATLSINIVQDADEGIYTCFAKNDHGETRREIKVVVESKPYFLDVSKRPVDISIAPGMSISLTCEPEGKPKPEIVWMKDGELEGSHAKRKSIHIKKLRVDHTGVYQCVATNKHGSVVVQGFLNVIVLPPTPDVLSNNILYRKQVGSNVRLFCKMYAIPSPTTTWRKLEQLYLNLTTSKRIDSEDGALIIRDLIKNDTGTYQCNTTNKEGSYLLNITLQVLRKTELRPKKEKYYVQRGGNVTLEIIIVKDPFVDVQRITWTKNAKKLSSQKESLTILDALNSHAGKYVVAAETSFDSSITTMELVVQDIPNKPTDVHFTGEVNNSYAGTISWKKPLDNFSPIQEYCVEVFAYNDHAEGNWKLLARTNLTRYVVKDLKPWVKYKYRVYAVNGVGDGKPSKATQHYETPKSKPAINPTGVKGVGISPDKIVVSWDPIDPLDYAGTGFRYYIRWCLESKCAWTEKVQLVNSNFPEFSYTVQNTSSYSKYLIAVRSGNDVDDGPDPEVHVAISGQDIPLESPVITDKRVDNDSSILYVKWEKVPTAKLRGEAISHIVKANRIGKEEVVMKKVGANVTEATLQLNPYAEYEVTVVVENGAGESNSETFENVETAETFPDKPEKFAVKRRALNELELKWKAPSTINGVILGYKLTHQWIHRHGKIKSVTINIKSTLNHTLRNLKSATTYNLTLCAETSRGFGECANLTISTLAPRDPEQPVLSVDSSRNCINFTWKNSDKDAADGIPVINYTLSYRIAEKGDKWTVLRIIPVSRQIYSESESTTNLNFDDTYEFRVTAANAYGETSSNSTIFKFDRKRFESRAGIPGPLIYIIVLSIVAVVILVIIITVIWRKRKGGKYPVSEKEEQLVKQDSHPPQNDQNGTYSAASVKAEISGGQTDIDGQTDKAGKPPENETPLQRDGSDRSIEVYDGGDTREYEEDGSFIDQYGKSSTPGSEESNEMPDTEARLLANARHDAV